ncbi:hypothetical protein GGR56DRAFT_686076 [Xylariaceae sp. FL0804]|nr:hypothetical protein GGR56DRAFT_686076 [Xylariaceae sp. FL0804]
MDQHHLPRRSASHGTLRSSYSSHSRSGAAPSPARPLHKPLRSVNENSVLLPSPGALESMLKTTTETGDIGIFSIRPVPPSPQRRSTFSDVARPPLSSRPSADDLYRRNQSQRPPSARDATSEIVSMYGTESQRSATSTLRLSPTSTGDIGQRSYSMTTCGSRHLSHHKSTNTLQSQASGSQLQRPRSPFPYPTRLKRLGVRPASPAWTENGRVDYSRMVEIDRISSRTVHGHFKPAYPVGPRRPPPLGLRVDTNQSTPSLPLLGPPPNFHGPPPPPSVRTHSITSSTSWTVPNRDVRTSSSARTPSLTSIVSMYHRMPPALRNAPTSLSAPAPHYYDYTEDFHSVTSQDVTSVQPLAPVPTRASSRQKPLVLQESDEQLAAVFGEDDSAFLDTESRKNEEAETLQSARVARLGRESTAVIPQTFLSPHLAGSISLRENAVASEQDQKVTTAARSSDIHLLPSQVGRRSIDTFRPSLDVDSRDIPALRYASYQGPRQVQGVILRDDTQDCLSSGGGPDGSNGSQLVKPTVAASNSSSDAMEHRRCWGTTQDPSNFTKRSLDNYAPVASGEESIIGTERHGVLPDEHLNSAENWSRPGARVLETETSTKDSESNDTTLPRSCSQALDQSPRSQFRRHKRNQAVQRISTTGLHRDGEQCLPHILPLCSTAPLVSPKPISPARQLKVKNSIPRLMKALPPLPGSIGYLASPTPPFTGDDDDFDEILAPFNFAQSLLPTLAKSTGTNTLRSEPNINDRSSAFPPSPPKLRLKAKKPDGIGATQNANLNSRSLDKDRDSIRLGNAELQSSQSGGDSKVRSRSRLKLRSARDTRGQTYPESSVRRVPGAHTGTPAAVATSGRYPPPDLFTKNLRRLSLDGISSHSMSARTNPNEGSPQAGDDKLQGSELQEESTPRVQVSVADDYLHSRRSRFLKKHLSHLRAFLIPSSDRPPTFRRTLGTLGGEPETQRRDGPEKERSLSGANVSHTGFHAPFGRRIRARLHKWAKGAKVTVQRYASKNHGV